MSPRSGSAASRCASAPTPRCRTWISRSAPENSSGWSDRPAARQGCCRQLQSEGARGDDRYRADLHQPVRGRRAGGVIGGRQFRLRYCRVRGQIMRHGTEGVPQLRSRRQSDRSSMSVTIQPEPAKPFPVIVGVSGHRDILPEALPALRDSLRCVLRQLPARLRRRRGLRSVRTCQRRGPTGGRDRHGSRSGAAG